MLHILSDFGQNLSPVYEKNVKKRYKIVVNYKTDSYITTLWHVKSSESKISSYDKAFTVSHASRKHALIQQSERYARFLS